MTVLRCVFGVLIALVTLFGLVACGSVSPIDTLTPSQLSATRERALRRLSLATAYYEQRQNDVALKEVRAALQIDPNYADAYSLLGLIHQRASAPELAQQSFEHALQLAMQPPVDSENLAAIAHNYGWFLYEQDRFVQAKFRFEQALSQPRYRDINKTTQAMALCEQRARVRGG
jgi:type IV pilus assembly protein PilF